MRQDELIAERDGRALCLEHDWRLVEEERRQSYPPSFVRRWYCTRCRRFETWLEYERR